MELDLLCGEGDDVVESAETIVDLSAENPEDGFVNGVVDKILESDIFSILSERVSSRQKYKTK